MSCTILEMEDIKTLSLPAKAYSSGEETQKYNVIIRNSK